MRILFLTVLFLSPLYFFSTSPDQGHEVDTIAIKASAPDRIERILTVEPPRKSVSPETTESPAFSTEADEDSTEFLSDEEGDRSPAASATLEEVEEVQMSDIEESWHGELKQILNRLEPADGDDIHRSYLQEQESYKVMIDGLMSEKSSMTTQEASEEIEQMIQQLDYKHQEKLKEILGPHYEAVRDSYDEFMESSSQQE
jgi:hypothetical protein